MSDVMERTLASIPRLLSSALLGGGRGGGHTPGRRCQPSQSFQNFLKILDSARGRSQQADVVQRELSRIKQQFEHPQCSAAQWCEHFSLILFCSVLGYDVSFSYIYALKLAASGKGSQKRVGYLAATLLLDYTCDVTILITGTLLKDLSSSNMLDNLMALAATAELISPEHIPMMLPSVIKLLRHRQAMVRARAVHCMQAFFCRAPDVMLSHVAVMKGMLGDRDPGVLMAAVTTVEWLLGHSGEELEGVGSALINILQQIRAYKFPAHFCYHGLPLPWLQVKLLRVLSRLPPLDDSMTSSIVPLLSGILRDTVGKEMMSLAILEESLMTVAALAKALAGNHQTEQGTEKGEGEGARHGSDCARPSGEEAASGGELGHSWDEGQLEQGQGRLAEERRWKMAAWLPLLEEASRCVSSFLGADAPNLRYIGLKVLTRLVSVNVELAVPHKDRIVTCLSDPDLITRRQTLTLLHCMAVHDNFKAVCATMLKHVQQGDVGNETDVIDMVVDIGHRLNSDPEWYLSTIFPLLSWRLDEARLSAMMEDMLSFFTRSSRDSRWPQFPDFLFSTMVDNIIGCEGKGDPSVKFSLQVLRFVSLPKCEAFPRETFLAACGTLLTGEGQAERLKEQVVLCVQALMLRGLLDQEAVLAWAESSLDRCDHSIPCLYHFQLSELLRLASLETTDMASLSAQLLSSDAIDFSLSFLDLSAKTVPQSSRPFLKTVYPDDDEEEEQMAGALLPLQQVGVSVMSVKSEEMLSTVSSHGSSPLYASFSGSVKEDAGLLADTLKTLPGVKQRWTEHGFNDNTERKSRSTSPPSDSRADDRQTTPPPPEEDGGKEGEEEELTQALFQGLSPPSSVTLSLPPATSAVSTSTSSGFDSCTSQNSSGQEAPGDADRNAAASRPAAAATEGTAFQYAMVHSRPELGFDMMSDETDVLFSPSSPSNSWKVLHSAPSDSPTAVTPDTDPLSSSADLGDGASSILESVSTLSISDDSLENTSAGSIPSSPAKQAPTPNQPSPLEERAQDNTERDTDESVLSLFLEAQMTEKETGPTAGRSPDGEGDSLYSGFELLTPFPQSPDRGDVETQVQVRDEL